MFKIFLVVVGLAIISLLLFINFIYSYISLKQRLNFQKKKIFYIINKYFDSFYSQKITKPDFQDFLKIKKSLFSNRNNLNEIWKLYCTFIEKPKNYIEKPDITPHLLSLVHKYNQEIVKLQHKTTNLFFKLLNAFILHMNLTEYKVLHSKADGG